MDHALQLRKARRTAARAKTRTTRPGRNDVYSGVDYGFESADHLIAEIGLPPTLEHTIDRIESRRGYVPGNVRWATWTQQNRNRRNVREYLHNGKWACLSEHCEDVGQDYVLAWVRIHRYRWPFTKALLTPPRMWAGRKPRQLELTV